MNFTHHRIFKYIIFMPRHYVNAMNLDGISSYYVFKEFDSVSQSNVLMLV